MSSIQISNRHLIINADANGSDYECDIAFDTEKEAGEAMDLLAEALCGRWLNGGTVSDSLFVLQEEK